MTRLAENFVLAGDPQNAITTIEATLARLSGEEAAQVLMPTIRLIRAYAFAQQQRWDEAVAQLTEAVRQAADAHGDFEHALALDALCRVTRSPASTLRRVAPAKLDKIFTKLGVIDQAGGTATGDGNTLRSLGAWCRPALAQPNSIVSPALPGVNSKGSSRVCLIRSAI